MRIVRTIIAITLACLLSACAHMHVVCQDAGMTSLAVGGNNAGQQVLSAGLAIAGAAAQGAKLMARTDTVTPVPPSAQSQSYIDYNYLAMFGSDFASCNTLPPPGPPTTSVLFMSADGQVHELTSDSHQIVIAPSH